MFWAACLEEDAPWRKKKHLVFKYQNEQQMKNKYYQFV